MNEKINKLKDKFLDSEVKLVFKTCQETCDCCEDSLGCTKWKWIKVNRNEKLADKIEELKVKKESLKEKLKESFSYSENEILKKEIELIEKSIQKTKENKEAVLNILKENNKIEQIQQAKTSQQLVQSYQKVIDKGLTELQEIKQENVQVVKQINTERVILISLLVVSLVSVGGLLFKLRNKSKSQKKQKK